MSPMRRTELKISGNAALQALFTFFNDKQNLFHLDSKSRKHT